METLEGNGITDYVHYGRQVSLQPFTSRPSKETERKRDMWKLIFNTPYSHPTAKEIRL
jgi:hypothetical protein